MERREEIILASIEIRHTEMRVVLYSPDTALIATDGSDEASIAGGLHRNLGRKLVTTVKGHTAWVNSLACTMYGKALQRFVWHASGKITRLILSSQTDQLVIQVL